MSQIGKIFWLDNLRAVATISVVFLHVVSALLYQDLLSPTWLLCNFYDSMVRFCVPVFLMFSGALLLGREYDLEDFIKKRVLRVLLPFLFWDFIYSSYNVLLHIWKEKQLVAEDARLFLSDFIYESSYHFWYIYLILGIYLFVPILNRWIRNCPEKEIVYFFCLWLISMVVAAYLPDNIIPVSLLHFSGYTGYLVAGYYLANKNTGAKKYTATSLGAVVLGVLITFGGTWYRTQQLGKFSALFYDFLQPNVALMSLGIFWMFKKSSFTMRPWNSVMATIGRDSYGIFLAHVLVLYTLHKIHIDGSLIHPMVGVPLTTVCCIMISYLIIEGIQRLPYGKYVTGRN